MTYAGIASVDYPWIYPRPVLLCSAREIGGNLWQSQCDWGVTVEGCRVLFRYTFRQAKLDLTFSAPYSDDVVIDLTDRVVS